MLTLPQNAIQDELMKRGFSPDAGECKCIYKALTRLRTCEDPVMAEYITIMIINNKTPGTYSSMSRTYAL